MVTNIYVFRHSKQLFALEYISVGRTLPHIWTILTKGNKKKSNFFFKKYQKLKTLPNNNSGNNVIDLE